MTPDRSAPDASSPAPGTSDSGAPDSDARPVFAAGGIAGFARGAVAAAASQQAGVLRDLARFLVNHVLLAGAAYESGPARGVAFASPDTPPDVPPSPEAAAGRDPYYDDDDDDDDDDAWLQPDYLPDFAGGEDWYEGMIRFARAVGSVAGAEALAGRLGRRMRWSIHAPRVGSPRFRAAFAALLGERAAPVTAEEANGVEDLLWGAVAYIRRMAALTARTPSALAAVAFMHALEVYDIAVALARGLPAGRRETLAAGLPLWEGITRMEDMDVATDEALHALGGEAGLRHIVAAARGFDLVGDHGHVVELMEKARGAAAAILRAGQGDMAGKGRAAGTGRIADTAFIAGVLQGLSETFMVRALVGADAAVAGSGAMAAFAAAVAASGLEGADGAAAATAAVARLEGWMAVAPTLLPALLPSVIGSWRGAGTAEAGGRSLSPAYWQLAKDNAIAAFADYAGNAAPPGGIPFADSDDALAAPAFVVSLASQAFALAAGAARYGAVVAGTDAAALIAGALAEPDPAALARAWRADAAPFAATPAAARFLARLAQFHPRPALYLAVLDDPAGFVRRASGAGLAPLIGEYADALAAGGAERHGAQVALGFGSVVVLSLLAFARAGRLGRSRVGPGPEDRQPTPLGSFLHAGSDGFDVPEDLGPFWMVEIAAELDMALGRAPLDDDALDLAEAVLAGLLLAAAETFSEPLQEMALRQLMERAHEPPGIIGDRERFGLSRPSMDDLRNLPAPGPENPVVRLEQETRRLLRQLQRRAPASEAIA